MDLPTIIAWRTGCNPHVDNGDHMDHWRCMLRHKGRRMSVTFSMGAAFNGREPEAREVLSSLFLDASGIEAAGSFEDWCAEYGYDTDSRKAERTYKACQSEAIRLRKLLGDDYDAVRQAAEGV